MEATATSLRFLPTCSIASLAVLMVVFASCSGGPIGRSISSKNGAVNDQTNETACAQTAPSEDDPSGTADLAPPYSRSQPAIIKCPVTSLPDVASCLSKATTGSTLFIDIKNSLSCEGADCCPNQYGRFVLSNVSNVVIEGNGFIFSRTDPIFSDGNVSLICPALKVNKSTNVHVQNWHIDDKSSGCVDATCKETISVNNSSQLSFLNLKVSNTKGTAISIWGVNGFSIENSEIRNAGILGLLIGNKTFVDPNGNRYPSSNIKVINNKFFNNRTNGLALEGIEGTENIVSGNYFENNHWQGLWKLAGFEHLPESGGGQAWIGIAKNLEFFKNTISSGFCRTCQQNTVPGLELGYWEGLERIGGDTPLENIRVYQNLIVSNTHGIYFDATSASIAANKPRAHTVRNVEVTNNTVLMNTQAITLHETNAMVTSNTIAGWTVQLGADTSGDIMNLESSVIDAPQSLGADKCTSDFTPMFGSCVRRMVTSTIGNKIDSGIYQQGYFTDIPPEVTKANLNVFYRKGSFKGGSICLVFQNVTGQHLAQKCRKLEAQPRWGFSGASLLSVAIPPCSTKVGLKIGLEEPQSTLDIDRVQLGFH